VAPLPQTASLIRSPKVTHTTLLTVICQVYLRYSDVVREVL